MENYIEMLSNDTNKSSAEINHFLSVYGDGNMNDGLRRFAEYHENVGYTNGLAEGTVKGVVYCAAAILGVWGITEITKKIIESKKEQWAEEEKVLQAIRSAQNSY